MDPSGAVISRGPGVTTIPLLTEGNSLLSTVYVKAVGAGASVEVKYFDTTTGKAFGEKFNLTSHNSISTAGVSNRIVVTKIHNKVNCEITITGGAVEVGVFGTLVAYTATDIDSAFVLDGQSADLLQDKGLPVACYNETSGKFELVRCPMPIEITEPGVDLKLKDRRATTPLADQTLISHTVPSGQFVLLKKFFLSTGASSHFEIDVDGVTIASGRTRALNPNFSFDWDRGETVAENKVIRVFFRAHVGTPSNQVESYLMGSTI